MKFNDSENKLIGFAEKGNEPEMLDALKSPEIGLKAFIEAKEKILAINPKSKLFSTEGMDGNTKNLPQLSALDKQKSALLLGKPQKKTMWDRFMSKKGQRTK